MSDFSDKLASLLSKEAASAKGDPERMGEMIERLARGLGFTVSMAAGGDPQAIDTMIAAAERYALEEAADKAPFAQFMHQVRRNRP